mmetsp:Transcript_7758/g.13776  ORF Transcript_7758/g.13776 Transcript_7758/m.13776 type:complete len:572 (-) Transcript_7758:691-2406(-)
MKRSILLLSGGLCKRTTYTGGNRHNQRCILAWGCSTLLAHRARSHYTFHAHIPTLRQKQGHLNQYKTNLTKEQIQQLLGQYRHTLDNPDHTLVTAKHCKRRYAITRDDLKQLHSPGQVQAKENPYGSDNRDLEQYWLKDVVKLAKDIHGVEALIERYRRYLESGQAEEETYRKVYGWSEIRKQMEIAVEQRAGTQQQQQQQNARSWRRIASLRGSVGKQPLGLNSVKQSFITNLGIFSTKLGVWFVTGSAAMFADCMHSCADVLNATYRYYGIHKAEGTPDAYHPYGHERKRFVFADRSACGVLVIGGLLPFLHGCHELNTPRELLLPGATIAVFCVSALLESLQVKKAYCEIQSLAKEKDVSVPEYLKSGSEIMSVSTFTEACVGMVCSMIGIVGVVAAWTTGAVFWDSLSGILIAGGVSAASAFLLHKNEAQLVGCCLPIDVVVRVTNRMIAEEVVTSVHDIKTEVYGVTAVRYKAEVIFNAEAITRRYLNLHSVPSTESQKLTEEVESLFRDAESPIQAQERVEDFMMRNNAIFLANLCTELNRLEKLVKDELRKAGYTGVHVDLEPW